MSNETGASMEMPKYRCHKIVHALKIAKIDAETSLTFAMITPEDEGFAPFRVDSNYLHKHKPVIGGYYVVYADGYKSFSPAAAFEEGYTKIGAVGPLGLGGNKVGPTGQKL